MTLPQWLSNVFALLLPLLPAALWVAFWLWAVDWRKLWPALAEGAWAPCVLLGLVAATVWSRIDPTPCNCLGFVSVPNFWWQLGSVGALAAVALFTGWLQGLIGYEPPEIAVEPPAGHGHDHAHGHDHH